MSEPFVRFWFRHDGTWDSHDYSTGDPRWRIALLSMRSAQTPVRIQYFSKDTPSALTDADE